MILPMAEVLLLGPRPLLPEALAFLQREGVLQLRSAAGPGPEPAVRPCAPAADAARLAARLEDVVARAGAIAARLPPVPRAAAPEPLPSPADPALPERLDAVAAEVDALAARAAALREEAAATARLAELLVALAPFDHALDRALEPELHLLVLRPDAEAVAFLAGAVRALTAGACDVAARPLPSGETAVRITVPRAHGRALTALLFARGVGEVPLPARYAERAPVDVLLALAARARDLPAERAAADAALASAAARLAPALAALADGARAALARLRATGTCGETRFAFVVSGWAPEERVAALRAAVAAAFGDRAVLLAAAPPRERFGEVPVVLSNPRALRPFQRLLGLVALPRYGSLDPTGAIAIGFPLLFGFVLGDAAFGAIGIAVAALALRRGWGGPAGRDVAWIALACAASALGFGILFGEALGEVGARFGLEPVLFHRGEGPIPFLAVAVGIGAAHLLVGDALGIWTARRAGHRRLAVARAGKLVLLLAAVAWAAARLGALPSGLALPAAIAGAAGLAASVLAEGPLALLDAALAAGNVLSYARLMALGLASVLFAEVANGIAARLEPAAAGLGLGVFLHAVNFTLGLISPAIAALRLHYVEFFEKFYDEGGAPWRPFTLAEVA